MNDAIKSVDDNRYARQILLPEMGEEGQRKLSLAKVLVVGVGGLGSPISTYLVGAGVGHLGLVDADVVSVSNLHRQVLYSENQVGQSKALCAKQRLAQLNSDIEISTYPEMLTEQNADAIIVGYDIVVDGCDNFKTRYLISDVCQKLGKTYVYGSICGLVGQVSVFSTGSRTTYRTLYPDEAQTLSMPHPGKAVLGLTPSLVGSVEAAEVVKLICGFGSTLEGRLWTIDLRTWQSNVLSLV